MADEMTTNPRKSYLDKLADSMRQATDIPSEEQAWLRQRLTPISLKKHEHFLSAGEIPRRIGFNLKGLLRLYYIDREGNEVNKHFCTEHTMAISYSAFLQQEASNIFIQALEETDLLVLGHDTYLELLDRHPCWQKAARRLADMLYILKEKREYELLMHSAQERYLLFRKDYPALEQRLNQYQIASYLGVTPESLSRIRANLK